MTASVPTLATVSDLRQTLCSESETLARRFRALFSLLHVAKQVDAKNEPAQDSPSQAAIDAMAAAFASPSVLLKHELAYCLGQSANPAAVPHLLAVLANLNQDPMTRHEAGEALGALGGSANLEVLEKFRDRVGEAIVVRETCELAVERIKWEASKEQVDKSDFASVDPAPPFKSTLPIADLEATLCDPAQPLFPRYRAMFALRNLASPPDRPEAVPAVQALGRALVSDKSSVLFRHEVAFVFGQLAHPASIPALSESLANSDEAPMVRHEAAEALGSLGDNPAVDSLLRKFLGDPEPVVRDSIVVALDMAEYERGGQLEYALVPEKAAVA